MPDTISPAIAHDPVAATKIARIEGDLANLASSVKQLVDDTRIHRDQLAREREEDRKSTQADIRALGEMLGGQIAKLGTEVYKGTDWTVILTGVGIVISLFFGFSVYNNERFATILATIERDREVALATDTDLSTTAIRIDDALRAAIVKLNDDAAKTQNENEVKFSDLYEIMRHNAEEIGVLSITGQRNYEDIRDIRTKLDARTP